MEELLLGGRILNQWFFFIRDEIAILTSEKKLQEIHELFIDYIFLCIVLKYFWIDAFGINVG
jgi:hypothetical protein